MIKVCDYLTREQRIERIGELLSKEITLMLMREQPEHSVAGQSAGIDTGPLVTPNQPAAPAAPIDDSAQTILNYLVRVGLASAQDIQAYFGLHRNTASGMLKRMQSVACRT